MSIETILRCGLLKQVRIDSTVTKTLIQKPWDSTLLGEYENFVAAKTAGH